MAVRAALVTPLSGPLSGYGRATAVALRLWAERFTTPETVHLDVVDVRPDVSTALRRAAEKGPDLLFGPYGSRPTSEVAAATSRLVWNHGGARVRPRDNVVNVLAPADTYFTGALEVVRQADPRLRRVGVLHARTGFSRSVAEGAQQAAQRCDLCTDRVELPAAAPAAELLLVAGRFTDEVPIARTLSRRERRAVGLVAAGVREVLPELGQLSEGLLGPAQWLPETAPQPDEGPPASQFVAAYRARTGNDPPYPATQAFAAAIIAMRCVRAAGTTGDAALLRVARGLECTTLFGRFRLDDEGRQVGHQVVTVQWQDGARVVVWPPEQATAALRYPLR